MSNGHDSSNVLAQECESAIARIEKQEAPLGCNAHVPLSSGVIVLLRCEAAKLRRDANEETRAVAVSERILDRLLQPGVLYLVVLALVAIIAGGLGPSVLALFK